MATYSSKDYVHAKRVADGAIVKVPKSWLEDSSPYSDSFKRVRVKRAEPVAEEPAEDSSEGEDSEEGSENSEESSEEQQGEETSSPRRRRNRK